MNILIIGLGSIAKKHITAIRELLPHATLYALRSSENSIVYENVKNLLSLNELNILLDFIIISNPSSLHASAIQQSINFRCPLFVEKPFLTSLESAQSVIAEIEQKNIITYVACNLRFHPVIQYLKKFISQEKPRVNEVNIYCGSFLPEWRPELNFRKSYSVSPEMGGGVDLDLIHELDYCVWIFGMPMSVMTVKRSVSSLEIASNDYANYQLLYEKFSANVTLNYYRNDSKRVIEVLLNNDTLTADLLSGSVKSEAMNKIVFQQNWSMKETYLSQLKYFTDKIKSKQQPMNSFNEAFEILKIALS